MYYIIYYIYVIITLFCVCPCASVCVCGNPKSYWQSKVKYKNLVILIQHKTTYTLYITS